MRKTDIPIWRDATQLLLGVEQAVRHFPRYHQYTLGTEMRQQAMKICQLVNRAGADRARAPDTLPRLVLAGTYRLIIQPGVELCPNPPKQHY